MADYPALDLRFAPGPGAGTLQDFLYAELDAFEPIAIQEHEAGDGWRVFFRTPAHRDEARVLLVAEFGNALLDVTPLDVSDEDWARRSQASLSAIRVNRILVAPPWDLPHADRSSDPASTTPPPDLVIVIEPSMGFGTGHHATTRLCLELLQEIPLRHCRVIDVGTGSGVLAIAARMLGAHEVIAVDHDPDALVNARENIERNVGPDAIEVAEADLAALSLGTAQVVTANLTGAVLQKHAADLLALLAEGGSLIVSGFSPAELPDVLAAFGRAAAVERHEGEWAAARICNP